MSRSEPLNVTKTFFPPLEEYQRHLDEIWQSGQLTNLGPKHRELESALKERLGVRHCMLVNNGTIAIQIAIKALGLTGKVITTPFSYVATVSSLVWEGCEPVFVDIDPNDLCIDASLIEKAITDDTVAILATHVYGFPCNVHRIEEIAKKHGLKVIYDAAHAFGVQVDGSSVLNFDDISTLSFHATKVFHTGEGGALVTNDDELAHRISYLRNFGHDGPLNFQGLGVNAKMSELNTAMGLCVLKHFNGIMERREKATMLYQQLLQHKANVELVTPNMKCKWNHSYFPVLFNDEAALLAASKALNSENIFPRRYFNPALNRLPYVTPVQMPVAENASARILCLPLSDQISEDDVRSVCNIILKSVN